MIIDLNANLGEGGSNDEALLQLVTSANIACGFHAGDAQTMLQSVRWGMRYGVALGAHPQLSGSGKFWPQSDVGIRRHGLRTGGVSTRCVKCDRSG